MDSLPPIPTPVAQRWREFRIQVLPLVVFVGLTASVVVLWKGYVQPVGIVGQVEMVRANVASIQEGTVLELSVDRLEHVSKDQPIGKLVTTDPAVQEADLIAITADLKLVQARMDLDKIRNKDTYSQRRVELLAGRVSLLTAQARLPQAESELVRVTKLFEEGPTNIASQADLEVARRDRDTLKHQIEEQSKLVAQLEVDIQAMESAGVAQLQAKDPFVEEAIKAQQQKLTLLQKPVVLKSPIDGTVSAIAKRPGEKVVRGESILIITAPTSDRIVGYMRQPLGAVPTTNDTVLVRTRTLRRQMAEATIVRVGTQMEPIDPALLSPDGTRREVGLPFLINIPDGMHLVPGEFVDIAIHYRR
jgi:multidrug resistance efflux pump